MRQTYRFLDAASTRVRLTVLGSILLADCLAGCTAETSPYPSGEADLETVAAVSSPSSVAPSVWESCVAGGKAGLVETGRGLLGILRTSLRLTEIQHGRLHFACSYALANKFVNLPGGGQSAEYCARVISEGVEILDQTKDIPAAFASITQLYSAMTEWWSTAEHASKVQITCRIIVPLLATMTATGLAALIKKTHGLINLLRTRPAQFARLINAADRADDASAFALAAAMIGPADDTTYFLLKNYLLGVREPERVAIRSLVGAYKTGTMRVYYRTSYGRSFETINGVPEWAAG